MMKILHKVMDDRVGRVVFNWFLLQHPDLGICKILKTVPKLLISPPFKKVKTSIYFATLTLHGYTIWLVAFYYLLLALFFPSFATVSDL